MIELEIGKIYKFKASDKDVGIMGDTLVGIWCNYYEEYLRDGLYIARVKNITRYNSRICVDVDIIEHL